MEVSVQIDRLSDKIDALIASVNKSNNELTAVTSAHSERLNQAEKNITDLWAHTNGHTDNISAVKEDMRETKLDNKNLRTEFKEVFKKIEAKHTTSVESCKLVYDRVDELERKNISEDSHDEGWKAQWALIGAVLVALAAIVSAFVSYEQYAHPVKIEKTK